MFSYIRHSQNEFENKIMTIEIEKHRFRKLTPSAPGIAMEIPSVLQEFGIYLEMCNLGQ